MADRTAIEWTEATWNPVTGCTRVSPGCARCYIERTPPFRIAGRRFARVGNEETTGVRLHPERLERPLGWRKPRTVFVCSMADLFHEEVPEHFIAGVCAIMSQASQHTFQVLTKRPERARDFLEAQPKWHLPENVWIGVSIENARYTWRADVLREIPAAVRFVSAEPLIGSLVEDDRMLREHDRWYGDPEAIRRMPLNFDGIDWLIVGGESGPGARPMHPEWAREVRDACVLSERGRDNRRVPAFFFKQWGSWQPDVSIFARRPRFVFHDGSTVEANEDSVIVGGSRSAVVRMGWAGTSAKSGGRLLDGRTWDELPARKEAPCP